MAHLPEPRRFGGGSVTDELVLTAQRSARTSAIEQPQSMQALRRALCEVLEQGDEARLHTVRSQLSDASSTQAFSAALVAAVDTPSAQSDLVARAFALPLVLVAGSAQRIVLPARLPDAASMQQLFERSGVLGPTRNFGMSDALCSLETVEALSPFALFRALRELNLAALTQLSGSELAIDPGSEQAHLRFLIGAGLTAADAPGFAETGANIGSWGTQCAGLLQRQLSVGGLQLLVLPRPPQPLAGAAQAGRFAQLEIALHLFASNAVRRFRMTLGDPVVLVSAHDDAQIRVTLSSPFAADPLEGFCWPLHPTDDLAELEHLIVTLFGEMNVPDVRIVSKLLASRRPNGAPFHPRSEDWESLAATAGAGTRLP